jgi:hypothetical protein
MKKVKCSSTWALAFSLLACGTAQAEWIKSYGTINDEIGVVTRSSKGGYYLAAVSTPKASGSKSVALFSLLNLNGKPLWTKKITSGAFDNFSLGELSNGRVLLQGTTQSTATGPGNPVWAVYNLNRTTGALSPVFRKTYKGKGDDHLTVTENSPGVLWGTGSTTSFSLDGKGTDMIVAKINPTTGVPVWSKVYHNNYYDSIEAFIPKGDKFILLANAGLKTDSQKILLGLLNNLGAPVTGSFKQYGGTGINSAINIKPISGGNYLVYGVNRTSATDQNSTIFVMKLNSNLSYVWGKKYATGSDQGLRIANISQNADGSFTLTGSLTTTIYFSGFPVGAETHPNAIKITSTGDVISSKSFEYQEMDASNFSKNPDSSYLLSGSTMPFNLFGGSVGDMNALYGHFRADFAQDWVKTLGGSKIDLGFVTPESTGYWLSGSTSSWGAGNMDVLAGKLDANGDVPGCPHISEVSMIETAPKISASNLNWKAQAATLVKKGAITPTDITLNVTSATITATNVCAH